MILLRYVDIKVIKVQRSFTQKVQRSVGKKEKKEGRGKMGGWIINVRGQSKSTRDLAKLSVPNLTSLIPLPPLKCWKLATIDNRGG